MKSLFHQFQLDIAENLFQELARANSFEPVTEGRMGNHLMLESAKGFPLVRTTTKYDIPAQKFSLLHKKLARQILEQASEQGISITSLNNALVELYNSKYRKMGYHSDQALDLEADSYIAIFSCYSLGEDTTVDSMRTLYVRCKKTNEISVIPMQHNSVLMFSLETNRQFRHKIILDRVAKGEQEGNQWLGITFRQSKTWIYFQDQRPYFENGEVLTLATEEQKRRFFRLRGEENRSNDFEYPFISYTISPSDVLEPI